MMAGQLKVERVDDSELDTVARILAAAYTNDPIHVWAMPNSETRMRDAVMFFTFYFRWMQPRNWEVFATSDRTAVLVTRLVRKGDSVYPKGVRHMPSLVRADSPANEYFRWIETFRPDVDHRYTEFLGSLPDAPRGIGFFLFANVLKIFDQEGWPVWSWSSNPLNLPFYRRLGFEIGPELRRDDKTPPVTIIWRPVTPQPDISEKP